MRTRLLWILALVLLACLSCGSQSRHPDTRDASAPSLDAGVGGSLYSHKLGSEYPAVGGDLSGNAQNATVTSLSTSNATIPIATSSLAFGTNPASTGLLRFPNNVTSSIVFRNTANSGNLVGMWVDSGNELTFGDYNNSALIFETNSGAGVYFQFSAVNEMSLLSSGLGLNVPLIEWTSGTTAPTIEQLGNGPSSGTAQPITITPQAPNATNGTPGNAVVALSAPTGSGSEAMLEVTRGGTFAGSIGPYPGLGSSYSGVWLGPGTTPSSSNYSVAANSTTTYVNGSSAVILGVNGGAVGTYTSSGFQLLGSSTSFGGGTVVLGISNDSADPTSNPSSGGVIYESSGELVHRGPSGAITELGSPGSGTQNTQKATFMRRSAFLHTTSTSTVGIYPLPALASSHVFTIEAVVQCIDTTGLSSSAASRVAGSFVNSGGTVSQLGSTTTIYNHNFTSPPSFTTAGGLALQVTPKTTDATDCQADVWIDYD